MATTVFETPAMAFPSANGFWHIKTLMVQQQDGSYAEVPKKYWLNNWGNADV